ncbi:Spx/MgsR family RNA polymerase-binding regulatory protein [Yanghanlia caeni]|uniref:Spx/MgsR family RNA polymerase-binding regulatory protein n=1 Tax=Yanghanlia caeni TaxID=3064283 RepID=A0ABU1D6A6_9BURK|nr:Spx/MgsR family RNA polymerase-binding regulatory protein [Alcaligenaceae bacterium LG-2]NGR08103.1 Spx/MgsR family RNA polymerase-binding regulatory protein [bacterium SGD-2]HZH57687.1 Spx/MgsR family RNA polymerase-binding regulatory protein [Burkholderiaceae bacterium]
MSDTPLSMYGLAKCSTCVKAQQWLQQRGVQVGFTDYREHPLPSDALLTYSRALGGWEKLVNRASMTWRNLPDARKNPGSDDEWLALIAEFPALVRRPLVLWPDGTVTTGFTEKKFLERLAA